MDPTLHEWFEMDDDARSVVMDELLERMPPGYLDLRTTGMSLASLGPLPRFLHLESNVLFHVLFRGPMVMGMTDERVERLKSLAPPAPNPVVRFGADLQGCSPPREVEIETCLVADDVLLYAAYKKLGVEDESLSSVTFDVRALPAVLSGLASRGWRAPSEAEWEYALRAVEDAPVGPPPREGTGLLRTTGLAAMGLRPELCRDDWALTLRGYPSRGSRGVGHGVVRGPGTFFEYFSDDETTSWAFRQAVMTHREPVGATLAIRPWVELPK